MSMDSDIKEIKSALGENKRTLSEMQRELQSMKSDLKKIQDSGSNDFFKVVKGTALVTAISKISSIGDLLEKIERKLQ